MQLKEYLKDYHEFSGKASDITRQFAFAAIAIIWIFKGEGSHKIALPPLLIKSGAFIITAMILDLFQYVITSIIWKIFHSINENKGVSPDTELKASSWLLVPGFICYVGKITFVIIGYFIMLTFLFSKM